MKLTKRIISVLLCLILMTAIGITTTAVSTPNITLSNVKAMPGETVTIEIKIANNPGIMAMSFCITYDSDAFEYAGYGRGYLSRYTIKDHADKGQIAFVNDEAGNKSNNGVMLSVKFLVKENAKPGKHTITIANQNREKHGNKLHNSFSNSDLKYIVPSVTAGSITVGETCENAGHKYGEWEIITPADCKTTGEKKHTCIRCNQHSETIEIPITHDFEAEWTVDKAATPTEDGIMSRHCTKCDAVTDKITFTYKEVEDSQKPDDNTSSDDSISNDNSSSDENAPVTDTSSDAVSDENSSESNASDNQGSEKDNSSDTTISTNSSTTSSSTKTPINNTVGSKNPQSAVENIKDYQENIKPNLNSSISSDSQSSDTQSENISDSSSTQTDAETNSSSPDQDNITPDSNKNVMSGGDIALIIISSILSVAIIAMAIILIVRHKKENNQ